MFTNRPLEVRVKPFPITIIKRLEVIQKMFDDEVEKEIKKASKP